MADGDDKNRKIVFTGASGGIGTMTRPLLAKVYRVLFKKVSRGQYTAKCDMNRFVCNSLRTSAGVVICS